MQASTTLPADDLLQDIDLEATVPCEVRREADATWHAFGSCPGCGTSRHALVCEKCRITLTSSAPTRCSNCNYSGPGKKFFTRTMRL